MSKLELVSVRYLVVVEYIPQRRGVSRASKYPKKLGEVGVREFISPPDTKKKPPIVAMTNPMTF
ncbi:MAG: hypothetical protein ACTSR8_14685 [Promethearchaeota archaeon]